MKRLLTTLVALVIAAAALPGSAMAGDKVTICHAAGLDGTTKFVTITISENAAFGQAGHFYENGTPRAGHEQDYLGPCDPLPLTAVRGYTCGDPRLILLLPDPITYKIKWVNQDGEKRIRNFTGPRTFKTWVRVRTMAWVKVDGEKVFTLWTGPKSHIGRCP